MTTPLPGFVLLSLVLGFPPLLAGESDESAAGESDREIAKPEAVPIAITEPAVSAPATPVASAPDSGSAETKPPSVVLSALRESFHYDPGVRAKSAPIASADQASSGTDTDTVVLPKVEVAARPLGRGLSEAIANQRPTGPQNHSKFGTGIHEKDFGKVRASVVTIFYVPVLVGFSW